jgi:hypothetical protein
LERWLCGTRHETLILTTTVHVLNMNLTSAALGRLDGEMGLDLADTQAKSEIASVLSKLEGWAARNALPEHNDQLQTDIDWIDDVSCYYQGTPYSLLISAYTDALKGRLRDCIIFALITSIQVALPGVTSATHFVLPKGRV